ncbi:MAG: sugar phosphate isomerase/epimerase family protein [Bacteroidota bacterium]
MIDLKQLCVHTISMKQWSLEESVQAFGKAGIGGITIWRDANGERSPEAVKALLASHNLDLTSYCRGGFFPALTASERQAAIEDNLAMIREAAALEAPLIVLVCGAAPGQSLVDSRAQIQAGIEAILPLAEALNVKLAIEPLHPMYADTRSAINTLAAANEMAEAIDSPYVGVAIDVYHVWWEAGLEAEIERCGKHDNIFAYHICDWKVPTKDLLLDRGLMGEGCINIDQITAWVRNAGFKGRAEVEIFSNEYWSRPADKWFEQILTASKSLKQI